MDFLSSLGSFIFSAGVAISGFLGFHQAPIETSLGVALPATPAVFETSLASPITSSASTMTLTANAIRGGGAVSGFTCFTVDEGSAQAETICGTVSGTTVSSLSRGISQSTGTTTVAALQFAHRRGANVKVTDFPVLQIVKAQNNGEDTFPNILNYTSHPTFVATTNIVDKKYVDDTAFSGAAVIDATTAARGVVELATAAEAAASTATGSSGKLVIPASVATSSWNSATAGNVLPMTGLSTKIISPSFIFPQGAASSTVLSQDATGAVSWQGVSSLLNIASSSPVVIRNSASTTVLQASLPASFLGTRDSIRATVYLTQTAFSDTQPAVVEFALGNATTTYLLSNSGGTGNANVITFVLKMAGATNAEKLAVTTASSSPFSAYPNTTISSASQDMTTAKQLLIVAKTQAGGSNGWTTSFANVEVLRQ